MIKREPTSDTDSEEARGFEALDIARTVPQPPPLPAAPAVPAAPTKRAPGARHAVQHRQSVLEHKVAARRAAADEEASDLSVRPERALTLMGAAAAAALVADAGAEHVLSLDGMAPRVGTMSRSVFTEEAMLEWVRRTAPLITAPAAHEEAVAAYVAAQVPTRRAHLQLMMRTPTAGEHECCNKGACFGRAIVPRNTGTGATLMAYYLPSEWADYVARTAAYTAARDRGIVDLPVVRPVEKNRPCVLCQIAAARALYFRRMLEHAATAAAPQALLPPLDPIRGCDFSALVDVPGEFHARDCFGPSLVFPTGLVAPVPRLDLMNFEMVPADGYVIYRCLFPVYGDTAPVRNLQAQGFF